MHKTPKYERNAPLLPIPVTGPCNRLSVDVLGPFPVTHSGNRYVVCFTDYLTRWPEVYAVPTAEAPVIAKFIATEILPRHGAPRILLSDYLEILQNERIQEMTSHLQLPEARYTTLNRQFLQYLLTRNRSVICPQCWLADTPETVPPPTSPSNPVPDNSFEWPTYAPSSPS